MLSVYQDQCAPIAAFLDVGSLNVLVQPSGDDAEGIEVIDTVPDLSPTPEELIVNRQLVGKLHAFIASLPYRLAEIVHRHYWLGHSQSEIAADLGVSPSAVCHALGSVNRKGRCYFGVSVH